MKELVFVLEEESAKVLLEQLVPRLIPESSDIHTRYIVFQGKQDLHKQLAQKVAGYLNQDAKFIVLRDQDRDDCRKLKHALSKLCRAAGRPDAIIRIACRELETFYLGDLRAVEVGLGVRGLSERQKKVKFRDPDALRQPSVELENITGRRYQKMAGSRAIAPHLMLESSRSTSFQHLIRAIQRVRIHFDAQPIVRKRNATNR